MVPILLAISWYASTLASPLRFCSGFDLLAGLVDHYDVAMQTLSIIFVCTGISVLARRAHRHRDVEIRPAAKVRRAGLSTFLQTLPTFVYLIPLIFLFSVTEVKLYGIAIILYAIVPVDPPDRPWHPPWSTKT